MYACSHTGYAWFGGLKVMYAGSRGVRSRAGAMAMGGGGEHDVGLKYQYQHRQDKE